MSYPGEINNFEAHEGTINNETHTIVFDRRPRTIIVTNDSSTESMSFKFHENEDFGTILPTEGINLIVGTRQLIIESTGLVPYRIWGLS